MSLELFQPRISGGAGVELYFFPSSYSWSYKTYRDGIIHPHDKNKVRRATNEILGRGGDLILVAFKDW